MEAPGREASALAVMGQSQALLSLHPVLRSLRAGPRVGQRQGCGTGMLSPGFAYRAGNTQVPLPGAHLFEELHLQMRDPIYVKSQTMWHMGRQES